MMVIANLTGKTFGRLTVIEKNGLLGNGKQGGTTAWLCRCSCGELITVRGRDLMTGNTKSCGCFSRESRSKRFTTHGKSGTRLYKIWSDIKKRGHGLGSQQSRRFYKGVTICDEWLCFDTFYKWAKPQWSPGLVIDRIDTFKGYSPNNCRFITWKENNQNTKRSKVWLIFGQEFNSSGDAARAFNCSQSHIYFLCHGRHYNGKYYPPDKDCKAIKKYQEVI